MLLPVILISTTVVIAVVGTYQYLTTKKPKTTVASNKRPTQETHKEPVCKNAKRVEETSVKTEVVTVQQKQTHDGEVVDDSDYRTQETLRSIRNAEEGRRQQMEVLNLRNEIMPIHKAIGSKYTSTSAFTTKIGVQDMRQLIPSRKALYDLSQVYLSDGLEAANKFANQITCIDPGSIEEYCLSADLKAYNTSKVEGFAERIAETRFKYFNDVMKKVAEYTMEAEKEQQVLDTLIANYKELDLSQVASMSIDAMKARMLDIEEGIVFVTNYSPAEDIELVNEYVALYRVLATPSLVDLPA